MARQRKTRDVWDVQGNYGQGWETVTAEDTFKEARARLKEYRENEPQYAHRIKLVRESIEPPYKVTNPARASSPMAIPTRWVKAKVTRVGKQIQIRMGGRS